MNKFLQISFIATLALLCGCSDELLLPTTSEAVIGETTDALPLEGVSQVLPLTHLGGQVMGAEVQEGDFLRIVHDSLHIEQNGDEEARYATLALTLTDGTSQTLRLAQYPVTAASRTAQQAEFYRCWGVGYSYDAINDEKCNWEDIRCQVINRVALQAYCDRVGSQYLLNTNTTPGIIDEYKVFHSVVDYVQALYFELGANVNAVIFGVSVSGACNLFEQGVEDTYILYRSKGKIYGSMTLLEDPDEWALAIEEDPTILTASFRKALTRLKDKNGRVNQYEVDRFIDLYGTHIISYSQMGCELEISSQTRTKLFRDVALAKDAASAQLAQVIKTNKQTERIDSCYRKMETDLAPMKVKVRGGNVNLLNRLTLMTHFKSSDYDESALTAWEKSIEFSTTDSKKNNVDMVDMRVVPLSYFILDKDIRNAVEQATQADAGAMQQRLGNRNFMNASFKLDRNASITAQWKDAGGKSYTHKSSWNDDGVSMLIADGRPVGLVCRENIDSKKMHVVYPIYEGRAQWANGMGIDAGGDVYDVVWNGNDLACNKQAGVHFNNGDAIYFTLGMPTLQAVEGFTYEKAHCMPFIERPYSVDINGSLQHKDSYRVLKDKGMLYINAQVKGIPGWENTQQGSKRIMRMRNDYVFLYDPLYVNYKE